MGSQRLGDVLLPLLVVAQVVEWYVEVAILGCMRMVPQVHTGFCWRTARLAVVADGASAHHVFPGVFAATAAWQDMVQRQVAGLTAAVLAQIPVPAEYLGTSNAATKAGPFDHVYQANHRGQVDIARRTV